MLYAFMLRKIKYPLQTVPIRNGAPTVTRTALSVSMGVCVTMRMETVCALQDSWEHAARQVCNTLNVLNTFHIE